MATAAVARPAQALRQRRDAPRPSMAKRSTNADGNEQAAKKRKLNEPYVRDTQYILNKHKGKSPSMTIHLHNNHWKFGGQDGSFAYSGEMRFILEHLRKQTIPHQMIEDLLREGVPFYDGCLIVEVHNHKTAGGKDKGRGDSETGPDAKHSMHRYNQHVTPSPLVSYPQKAREVEEAEKEDGAGGDAQERKGKEKEDGPVITTMVLHPTALSSHHELLLLANTPASELRGKKKGNADTPSSAQPQTPSLSISPTPITTTRGPLSASQKMCLEEGDFSSFQGEVLVATEPPLCLDLASNPQDAQRILDNLAHPLHNEKPPSPKTRKRTTAEMAHDDAQAAEAERRMLIMDERIKPAARGGAAAANENTGTAASLGFSRFKTIEMARQKVEEMQQQRKEEEARLQAEKTHQAEQASARQAQQQQAMLAQKQREMQQQQMQAGNNQQQRQQAMLAQQQIQMQQHQQQQARLAAAREHGHPQAANQMMQAAQQQNFAQSMPMQGSPVVRQQTPMMNSSPMMPQGGFPMVPTSSQGAGSPPHPTSAIMQNRNVAMARQASQQHPGSQNTPQIPQGTPSMAASIPNRQMSQTPRMPPGSPATVMQGTPTSANGMTMPTPHMMNQSNLTPEQMRLLQQQHQLNMQHNQQNMQGQGNAGNQQGMHNMTPEQIQQVRHQQRQQQAMLHAQQQQMAAQGQQITPQMQAQFKQRMMQQQMAQAQQQQQQRAKMQQMQQLHMMQQMQNGQHGSPASQMNGMPQPTPQMAHAHPQTPAPNQTPHPMPQQPNGQNQPQDLHTQQQQYQHAQQRAQALANNRQINATLQHLQQQYGGLARIPPEVQQSLPQPVIMAMRQHLQQQRARQQQAQMAAQVGQGMQGTDQVVPGGGGNPGYMQQLRQNQAMMFQQMQQLQNQQNGGMNGQNMNMQAMNMNMGGGGQQFGGGGGGQNDLNQRFADMQRALQNQQQGGGGGMQ